MESGHVPGWSSSSHWQSTHANALSKSSQEKDDEEARKWSAIERLPTSDRLKKGLAYGPCGEASEIDIDNIGYQEKKELIGRLVKATETDNEKFLLKLKDRIDRVGIELPTIEIRFEHLTVSAEAYVGSRGLPSFKNFFVNLVEGLLNSLHLTPSKKRSFPILRDLNGIIKPGRMTLLLGPPSSGKTTLLLALAGKLDPKLHVSGRVSYNGHDMDEFVPLRTATYISQHDVHIAEMTTRETLTFSARCQGVGNRYKMLAELLRREKLAKIKPDPDVDIFMKAAAMEGQEENVVVNYIIKILGLEGCEDTIAGNEMLRGLSGGERKRLTIGEMLVGQTNALLIDEISNGLDSSTAFQILNCIKQFIHILHGTAVVALLQPAPEIFNLFDDVILLSDGQVVYQGPREHVLEFFESRGFRCPERKGVADFLQEVTSRKDQMQYWAYDDKPYSFVTVQEFAEAFQSFHVGCNLGDEMAIPFPKDKSHPDALTTTTFGASKMELLKACFSRELLMMKRNILLLSFQSIWVLIVGLITMTLFIRTNMHRESPVDAEIYMGSLFNALSVFLFNGLPQLAPAIARLPVFYKQRDFLFFPAWAYAMPICILNIPLACVEVSFWVFSTYYVTGYDPDAHRFLKQWLLLLIFTQVASGIFRCVGAVGRTMNIAFIYGSFLMLMLFALGGFVLSREDVKQWWLWGYWISPLMYAQNAIAVNEFLGKSWNHVVPFSTEPLGVVILKYSGLFPEAYWYWLGVVALIGFALILHFLYAMALASLRPIGHSHAFIPVEAPKGENGIRSREVVDLPMKKISSADEILSREERNGTRKSIISTRSSTMGQSTVETTTMKCGMILPFEPHSVTFENIRYSVDTPQEMKNQGFSQDRLELLKGVSGAFRPGILTALMGVSGAGKTTLMDVLAGRKTGGYIEGNITISGYPKQQETFARISGYCEQNDIHSPHVTVRESLIFSAWLRLPLGVDSKTRNMFIDELMDLVELKSLGEAIVGLPGVSGLSMEQRKRLTVAVELVANPSILFMDEPTSGLDARAAAIVMRTIRNIVDTGRTIVCTIHQPSIDIFEAFDELFLMKLGGQEIYWGPLGRHSCHLINYFEEINGISNIDNSYNPATWVLENTSRERETIIGVDFGDIYRRSELYETNKALIKELSTPSRGSKGLHFPTKYSQSFWTQCIVCLQKQHWSYWHNTAYTSVRTLSTIVIALLIGSMFWDLGSRRKRAKDLLNAMGSMYTTVLFIGFQNAFTVLSVVFVERTVYYRERAAGMYSALPYTIAQVMIEVPYIFVQALIYGVIVYTMIGFQWTVTKFTWFFFFMYFTFLYSTFFGMMCVAMTPNMDLASILCGAPYGLWNLFSGFMIPRPRAPAWWRWYFWLSPLSWTLYGLLASQFGDREDELDILDTVKGFLNVFFGFRQDFLKEVAAIICCLYRRNLPQHQEGRASCCSALIGRPGHKVGRLTMYGSGWFPSTPNFASLG